MDIRPLRDLRANPELRRRPHAGIVSDAPGAWPSGTRVLKTNSEPGDGHTDGAGAVVVGSVTAAPQHGGFVYCVLWDSDPTLPVHIHSSRLRKA